MNIFDTYDLQTIAKFQARDLMMLMVKATRTTDDTVLYGIETYDAKGFAFDDAVDGTEEGFVFDKVIAREFCASKGHALWVCAGRMQDIAE